MPLSTSPASTHHEPLGGEITTPAVVQPKKNPDPAPLTTRRQRPLESFLYWLFAACGMISVLTTFGIIYVLLKDSIPFFQHVSVWEFLSGREWTPLIHPAKFGVLPLVSGTLLITAGVILVALPLGLLTAIFLSEYASPQLRNTLKPILEVLAGVPTVVYGFFALVFITPALQKIFMMGKPADATPVPDVFNALSASIAMSIMILPLVSSLCEDALHVVPSSLREGAYALGATKMEVSLQVVVPAALSGIAAAFILAISRAIGETMIVAIAAGSTPNLTANPLESVQAMTGYIVAVLLGDVQHGTVEYQTIFAVGLLLFCMTVLLNIASIFLVKRFRQKYD